MQKKQSGKSTLTKVVSVRLLNKDYKLLVKKAGGKRKLSSHVKSVLTKDNGTN